MSKLMVLLCVAITGPRSFAAVRTAALKVADICDPLMAESLVPAADYATELAMLETFRTHLPNLIPLAVLKTKPWYPLMQNFAYPSVRVQSSSLFLSFVGDANTGKSTLANMILGRLSMKTRAGLGDLAPVGPVGGFTRQPRVFLPAASIPVNDNADPRAQGTGVRRAAAEASLRFDNLTVKGEGQEAAANTEDPLLIEVEGLSPDENVIVVDTADISSGSYKDENPRNLARAKQAIIPADVLVIMVDRTRYNNISYIKMIRRIFAEYGQRKSVLVWRGAPPEGDEALAVRFLREFAWEIYDTPGTPKDLTSMPEGVHATYYSPDSDAVDRRIEFPELKPLNGSPEVDDLIQDLRTNAQTIKSFSVKKALDTIRAGVRDDVTAIVRQHAAGDLVAQALKSSLKLFADSIQPVVTYSDVREQIRKVFTDELPGLKRFFVQVGSYFRIGQKLKAVDPEKAIAMGQNSRRAQTSLKFANLMMAFLKEGKLDVAAPEAFRTIIDTFARKYNVEGIFASADPNAVATDHGFVELPSFKLLSPEAQRALSTFESSERIQMISAALSHQMEKDDAFTTKLVQAKDDQIRLALNQGAVKPTVDGESRPKVRSHALGDTVAVSLTGLGILYQATNLNPVTMFSVCVLGAGWACGKFIHTKVEETRDEMLEKTVMPFLKKMQTNTIEAFFKTDPHFKNLIDTLQSDFDSVRKGSIEAIRSAMAMDLPEYNIPDHVETEEFAEPVETIGEGRRWPFGRKSAN